MKYLIFLISLFSGVANATIYECNINGSKTFQSKPCAGSKELKQQVEQTRVKQANLEKAKAQARYEEAQRAKRLEPRIGMSTREVEQSTWGYPTKTNTTTTTNSVFEQWVYRSGHNARYLHFTNGKLTSISE